MSHLAKTIKLNNNLDFPLVGLGTFESKNAEIMTNLIRSALDAGYRHIDTALFYANHKIIGNALTTIFAEGKYKREELFVTTKFFPFAHLNAVTVLEDSLKDLGLTYVDLFLIHFPVVATGPKADYKKQKPVHVVWGELEQAVGKGLTKSIGVSNFNVQSLVNILSFANIKPVVNQFEHHVYFQQPELVKFCQKNGIVVTAYSPFCKGGLDSSYNSKVKLDIFGEQTLIDIAKKHGKSVGQVVLNFYTTNNVVVIPKTEKAERLAENINFFDFQLSAEEIEAIRKLDKGIKILDTKDKPEWDNVDIWA